ERLSAAVVLEIGRSVHPVITGAADGNRGGRGWKPRDQGEFRGFLVFFRIRLQSSFFANCDFVAFRGLASERNPVQQPSWHHRLDVVRTKIRVGNSHQVKGTIRRQVLDNGDVQ